MKHPLAIRVSLIADEIFDERLRQNYKFTDERDGIQRHNLLTWACVLAEESGEVVQAALQAVFDKQDLAHVREELVQTAAVAFAIIERIDDLDKSLFTPEGTYNG